MSIPAESDHSPSAVPPPKRPGGSVAPAIHYQPLVSVALAVAAGIAIDRMRPLPCLLWWLLGLAAWGAWLALWRRQWDRAAAWPLLAAALAAGATWHHQQWYLFSADHLGRFARTAPQAACLKATACQASRHAPPPPSSPLQKMTSIEQTRLEVEVTALRDGTRWRTVSGAVNVVIDGYLPQIRCGDQLEIFAKLVAPEPAHNPGEIDYARYWRADRHLCQLRAHHAAGVRLLAVAGRWSFRRWIDAARLYSHRILDTYLDRRCVGLAGAVLLGTREQLDPEQTSAFVETGSVHLLVVSGLSVGILTGALWFLLRRIGAGRLAAAAVVAAAALFYMFFKDVEPPVVRATILVLGTCLAFSLGRPSLAFNTLAAAALVILIVNPSDLFNVGAQLSFLCVAGMAWLGPRRGDAEAQRQQILDRLVQQSQGPLRRGVMWIVRRTWDAMLLGLIVWVIALPLVMARFHLISPVGPLLNVILLIPVELALVSGFGLLLCGWFPPLGQLLGGVCGLSLGSMQTAVDAARRIPHGCVWVPGPSDWWLIGLYGALGLAAMVPRLRPPRRWSFALLGAWTAVGFAASNGNSPREQLECTFLSVEHGLSVVVRLPSGRTLLYDAGQSGSPTGACRRISGFLWSKGITHLDAVMLSHCDIDHYNALPDLLDRFSIGVVYVSPVMFRGKNRASEFLHDSIGKARVPLRLVHAGDRLHDEAGCTLRILHPPAEGIPASDNTNSVVLAVEYAGRRVLLTGDLEKQGMDTLIAQPPCPCEVALSPHHGSRRSQPQRLLAWAKPAWVVVSGGQVRSFEENEATYTAAGCRAMYTSISGAIRVRITAAGVAVEGFRQASPLDPSPDEATDEDP